MKALKEREDGISMVEGAIVIPLLTVLLFSIIQWAMIMSTMVSIRNSSAVAARRFLVYPLPSSGTWDAEAKNIAAAALGNSYDANRLTASVQQPVIAGVAAAYSVTITYNLDLFLPFIVPTANANGTYDVSVTTTVG